MMVEHNEESRGAMAELIAWTAYPTILVCALYASWWGSHYSSVVLFYAGGVVLASALLIGLLEHIQPLIRKGTVPVKTQLLDIVHSLVSAAVVFPVIRALLLTSVAVLGSKLSVWLGFTIWPSHWPLALQVVLAVAVADLGAYWAHRSMHLTRIGWRLHALHHTPLKLNFLAAGRSHPFNAAYTLGAENIAVLLLGITPEALVLLVVFKGVNGLLQHSNMYMHSRWLSPILATDEVHHWHHSQDLHESNSNFGNTTVLWDRLFGTYFMPKDRTPSELVGISNTHIPESYLTHLAVPFILDRFESSDD